MGPLAAGPRRRGPAGDRRARFRPRISHAHGEEGTGPGPRPSRSGRRSLLFVGLTAINPTTLLYFTAMVAGRGSISSASAAVLFVVGVGVASATWQLLLVTAGALLRQVARPTFVRLTTVIANTAVAALGVLMIAEAITRIPS